jgi:hypothetical protein
MLKDKYEETSFYPVTDFISKIHVKEKKEPIRCSLVEVY